MWKRQKKKMLKFLSVCCLFVLTFLSEESISQTTNYHNSEAFTRQNYFIHSSTHLRRRVPRNFNFRARRHQFDARSIDSQPTSQTLDPSTTIQADKKASGQCTRFDTPRDFFVIGHAGGDPIRHCENTLEATRSALDEDGANAIELDLSISKDGIIFLWHDPHPLGMLALLRRVGFGINGRCRPVMDANRASYELTFKEIQDHWYYEDTATGCSKHCGVVIPTLEQWFEEFGKDPRIKLIWLDIKVDDETKISIFIEKLVYLLHHFHISPEKLQFSVREPKIGALIQEQFLRVGQHHLATLVVTDTQAVVPYVSNDIVFKFDGISKAVDPTSNHFNLHCGCCANLGLPLVVANRWESFKSIVSYNVAKRSHHCRLTKSHIRIYVFTIDDAEQMDWLLDTGVDGIITNKPGILSQRIQMKFNQRALSAG